MREKVGFGERMVSLPMPRHSHGGTLKHRSPTPAGVRLSSTGSREKDGGFKSKDLTPNLVRLIKGGILTLSFLDVGRKLRQE